MSKRNLIALGALFVVMLVAIFVTMYLIGSNQDNRSDANTPDPFPTLSDDFTPVDPSDAGIQDSPSCPDPGTVENVNVDYPLVEQEIADWNRAVCTWDSNPTATSYNVKIVEVDTGKSNDVIVNSGVNKEEFDVIPGNTYRCEVTPVNACNVAGIAGFDEQVCEVPDLTITQTPEPTITASPTAVLTSTPTATLAPQIPTATPILPPAGSAGTMAVVGIGGVVLLLIGGALLFL